MNKSILASVISAFILTGCQQGSSVHEVTAVAKKDVAIWPVISSEVKQSDEVEAKVDALLAKMNTRQKVAQMVQPEIRDITIDDMRKYGFGSYLNGGGAFPNDDKHATPNDWIALAESMYQASIDDSVDGSTIPTMWGTDAVHGHNNVIGATLFPHNIGLGAANNPKLIEQIAKATATEVMATGIDWVFAPTVATVRDDRWGRTYEGYSEDPEIVKAYASAIVHGLQGYYGSTFMGDDRVISTVKHFLGDGGTVGGDDQGDNIALEQDLFDIHAQGYVGGLTAGAQTVMASFNSWNGEKIHGNKYLLTDVLKNRMGFDGFVVGDWSGHGQIKGCSNTNCPQAINAGLDMFMAPTSDWKGLYKNTVEQVESGIIPMSRIDDAVRRILRVKVRAGLFEKPSPAARQFSGKTELIGSAEHRAIARDAVRQSLVLLKNNNNILPLSPASKIFITGDGADNIGKSAGGWSITWQGTGNTNKDFPSGTSIFQGFKNQLGIAGGAIELGDDASFQVRPDVAIVVFGEDPYAEGHGDRPNLAYQRDNDNDYQTLTSLKAQGVPVVAIFVTGRPMWINPELNASDAFVVVWLPGTEGEGIADVLLTDVDGNQQYDMTGKLSYSWPASPYQYSVNRGDSNYSPLFPYGYGLNYSNKVTVEQVSEDVKNNHSEVYKGAPIYVGKLNTPWVLWLNNQDTKKQISSSSVSVNGIKFRTYDKNVQEDAFQITANSATPVSVYIESKGSFREDLSRNVNENANLEFEYQVSQPLKGKAWLTLQCDNGETCGARVDISSQLSEAGDWVRYSVPLKLLNEKGMKFVDATSPFGIEINGSVELRVANVEFALEGKE